MEKRKSLKKLINQSKEIKNLKEGILFNDIYFPPSDKSIFNSYFENIDKNNNNKEITKPQIYLPLDSDFAKCQYTSISKENKYIWKNISYYIKDYNIINNNSISLDDIIQGNLGNSYFFSALRFLAEKGDIIPSLFDLKNKNKKYFEVFVYIHGYKYKIIVDDNFPFILNKDKTELIFCRINQETKNIWPMILEKVWAKINSNYENSIEGDVSDIFKFFTPFPIKIYYHDVKYNNLFEKIKNAIDNNFIVCTDINSRKENQLLKKLGVLSNHAYKIIGYGTLIDSNGNIYNLIKIYNNYEITSWIGDWGPGSKKWSDEFKKYLNYDPDKEKNVFYININDYINFYSTTYILYYRRSYFYFSQKIKIENINSPFTSCKIKFNKVDINESNNNNVTYFIINTKNKRFQQNFKNKKNFQNIFKSIFLYKKTEEENLILIDSICGKDERIFLSINNDLIKEGDEFIIFLSFPYLDKNDINITLKNSFSINPKRPNNICVGVYTNIIKENSDIKIESINNEENIEKYIIKSLYEKSKYNSHIYYFDKEKEKDSSRSINFSKEKSAYGYLVLNNNSNAALYEKITFFDYDNINILYFIKSYNNNIQKKTFSDIIDLNKRKIVDNLLKDEYTNFFEETKLNLITQDKNKNMGVENNNEKMPFDLEIKLGKKNSLLIIFEKCDDFASINIKSQINFLYPLYMIISENKNNTSILNRLEYKEKKIEIFENIIEHNYGVVFYYINNEKELNAKINIQFKEIKNLEFDMSSDQLNQEKNINVIKDSNNVDIIGIEIKLNSMKNEFFSLKTKNIFENYSYSFENKYTIYY